jgi:excisionase family DNA binding protein
MTTAVHDPARRDEGGHVTAPPRPRLVAIDEAADYLGTSTRFIRRLITERRITFTKLGRHVRIDVSDLDAFIAAGRIEARHR